MNTYDKWQQTQEDKAYKKAQRLEKRNAKKRKKAQLSKKTKGMKIEQLENGNIVIYNSSGEIDHILPTAYIHKHPRYPNDAVLLSSSTDFTDEQKGIPILAEDIRYINGERFIGDIRSLKNVLKNNFVLGGGGTAKDDTPKTKEEDPKYVEYLKANTYEKLHHFALKYKTNVGGITKQGDKLIQVEHFCQFQTFSLKIILRYHYRNEKPDKIDYILMSGGTQYVPKPKKVYVYDGLYRILRYDYKEALED